MSSYNFNGTKVLRGKNHCSCCYQKSSAGSSPISKTKRLVQYGDETLDAGGRATVTFDVPYKSGTLPGVSCTPRHGNTSTLVITGVSLSAISITGFTVQVRYGTDVAGHTSVQQLSGPDKVNWIAVGDRY